MTLMMANELSATVNLNQRSWWRLRQPQEEATVALSDEDIPVGVVTVIDLTGAICEAPPQLLDRRKAEKSRIEPGGIS
jgi:hypothetical protein